jgi:hypothetical protein
MLNFSSMNCVIILTNTNTIIDNDEIRSMGKSVENYVKNLRNYIGKILNRKDY